MSASTVPALLASAPLASCAGPARPAGPADGVEAVPEACAEGSKGRRERRASNGSLPWKTPAGGGLISTGGLGGAVYGYEHRRSSESIGGCALVLPVGGNVAFSRLLGCCGGAPDLRFGRKLSSDMASENAGSWEAGKASVSTERCSCPLGLRAISKGAASVKAASPDGT